MAETSGNAAADGNGDGDSVEIGDVNENVVVSETNDPSQVLISETNEPK